MSRVGKTPIQLPEGVTAEVKENVVIVKGKKGELSFNYLPEFVEVQVKDGVLEVLQKEGAQNASMYQGLTRSSLNNLVIGVSEGFVKELVIHGVGYKAQVQGTKLALSLGFSHPVEVQAPEGVKFSMHPKDPGGIMVEGIDLQLVGQVAANIRKLRPPEPYKGKGIRYRDEHIIRKAGKSAAK